MKKTTKAKAEVKRGSKAKLGPKAVRDLELMDPAARKLKGGAVGRKPRFQP